MLSLGMFSSLAAMMACRRREFPSRSPPPSRAARVISLINFVKILPRFESIAPFFRLIVLHLECPDMTVHLLLLFLKPARLHNTSPDLMQNIKKPLPSGRGSQFKFRRHLLSHTV